LKGVLKVVEFLMRKTIVLLGPFAGKDYSRRPWANQPKLAVDLRFARSRDSPTFIVPNREIDHGSR
jgi:hypothetical protein